MEGVRVHGEEEVHKEAINLFSEFLGTAYNHDRDMGRLQRVITGNLQLISKLLLVLESAQRRLRKPCFQSVAKRHMYLMDIRPTSLRRIGMSGVRGD